MKAVAYIRGTQENLEFQKSQITNYSKAHNYQVEKWFVDKNTSANDRNRSGLLGLKEWVPNNKGGTILLTGIDRLSRDFVLYADISKLFIDNNVNTTYLNCCKDGEATHDSLLQNILSAFAAYEKDVISERVKRGIAAAKARKTIKQ